MYMGVVINAQKGVCLPNMGNPAVTDLAYKQDKSAETIRYPFQCLAQYDKIIPNGLYALCLSGCYSSSN